MRSSTSVTLEEVHAFLWSKRNSRDLVATNQKVLAEEFGIHHIKFHRLVNQLLGEGKLKVTAVGSRGLKTFKVFEPAISDSETEVTRTSMNFTKVSSDSELMSESPISVSRTQRYFELGNDDFAGRD